MDRIIDRCLEKRRRSVFSPRRSWHALEAILAAPAGSAAASLRDVKEKSPYPGLSSFTEADSGRFFGREDEVKTLWQKAARAETCSR